MDRNNEIFLLWELPAFYANFVNKVSFVLSTNMAAMQTTYRFLSNTHTLVFCPQPNSKFEGHRIASEESEGSRYYVSDWVQDH